MSNAQRARLVIAMGVLNLILATVALTAGVVGPTQPRGDVAGVTGTPAPSVAVPASVVPEPTPTAPAPVANTLEAERF